jgi:betaine lipid synthase
MGTIKLFNARNNFLNSWFVQIPYYVFLGCSRQRDASAASKAFEMEAGSRVGVGQGGLLTPISPFLTTANMGGAASPFASPSLDKTMAMSSIVPPDFSLGPSAMEKADRYKGVPEGEYEWEQTIRDVGAPLSPFHYQLRKVSLHFALRM